MIEAGRIGLWVAVLCGLLAVVAGLRGRASLGRWLLGAAAAGAGLATVVLGRALATNDFSLTYVADNSRRGATTPYRVAALWGGMAGSLMFLRDAARRRRLVGCRIVLPALSKGS